MKTHIAFHNQIANTIQQLTKQSYNNHINTKIKYTKMFTPRTQEDGGIEGKIYFHKQIKSITLNLKAQRETNPKSKGK